MDIDEVQVGDRLIIQGTPQTGTVKEIDKANKRILLRMDDEFVVPSEDSDPEMWVPLDDLDWADGPLDRFTRGVLGAGFVRRFKRLRHSA